MRHQGDRWRTGLHAGWHSHRSWLRPARLVVLVAGLVVGSAPPPLSATATVGVSSRFGWFAVVGGDLVGAEDTTMWAGYDLISGERRWSLVGERSGARLLPTPRGALLHNPPNGSFAFAATSNASIQVYPAVDPASSVQLHPDGELALREGDHRRRSDGLPRGASLAHELTLIDLATGAEQWRLRPAGGVMAALGGAPPLLVTLTGDGILSTHDLTTGAVRATARVHATDPSIRTYPPLVLGDRVLIWYSRHDHTVLRAYRADTLSPQWQRRISGQPTPEPCAPMVCVRRPVPDAEPVISPVTGQPQPPVNLTVLDPADGEVGWQVAGGSRQLVPIGGRHLLYDSRGILVAVADPATGEQLRALRGWQALDPQLSDSRQLALVRTDVYRLPQDTTEQAPVALLDLDTFELIELFWVPGGPERCVRFARGLACGYQQSIEIWNWPPGTARAP